ncbi:hypothetical protein [Olivibacter sp. XZL3]|uniref:hypothetical protein n=1 Tax=Olivibacter sp. XZL3 TaxID=1735116 RepID=UPI001064A440|nr:hypothetical protein [Olivibacter sp. XZL3]
MIAILGMLITGSVAYAGANGTSFFHASKRATTYYVIGETANTYLLSQNPEQGEECNLTGSRPCQVTTTGSATLPSEVDKQVIDNQMNLTIDAWRDSF